MDTNHGERLQLLGRLAGGVAHDLNNTFTAVLGHIQIAMAELDPEVPAYKDLNESMDAMARATGLVRSILAFSVNPVIQPRVIEPFTFLDQTYKLLRRIVRSNIEISIIPSAIPVGCVKLDPTHLEQIIFNLVANARDAILEGHQLLGRITIEVGSLKISGKAFVIFSIQDNGKGMTQEVIEKLFTPFFTTKVDGHGLGLAGVQEIVKRWEGHIRIHSVIGVGSTFKVAIPAAFEMAEPIQPAIQDLRQAPRGTERILVADDDHKARSLAVRILRRYGYTVYEAINGDEALRILKVQPVDLIVTDRVMPIMGGRELAEHAKEVDTGIRVLFVSGYSEDRPLETAFMPKPFTPGDLLLRVRDVLDRKIP